MKKKVAAMMMAAAVAAIGLMGCAPGSSSAGNDSAGEQQEAQENQGEQEQQESEAGQAGEETPAGEEITLTIWDWDAEHLEHMTKLYQQENPNVKFETLIVTAGDYMEKLQSAIASGSGVPDVVLGELSYRGRLYEMGILEDLTKEPYGLSESDMFDFAVELNRGADGGVYGIEQTICPAGFAYRRDLAKEYLGTDDPDEISEMIATWDQFLELGKEVAAKSDGKVTIFPGVSVLLYDVLYPQNPSSYIEGNTIHLTERYKDILNTAAEMNQAGVLGKQERYTPASSSGMAAGEFIFYPCAPWATKWTIAANDPDGSGRWGLAKGPGGGFTNGGTSISIYSGSKNKEEAWKYIRYTYGDGYGVEEAFKKFGFMTGFRAPYEDSNSYFYTTEGAYDEFFGGQNLADYFINTISVETEGQIQTKYESAVSTAMLSLAGKMSADTSVTGEDALEFLKSEIQNLVPDAVIE